MPWLHCHPSLRSLTSLPHPLEDRRRWDGRSLYRAHDSRLNRDVAVKLLPADLANDKDRLQRFEQEAKATSALNHPNILTVYDIGEHEGTPFIVAELLEGEELRDLLQEGPLPPRKATDYAQQIVRGLWAAHEKGIIHRDRSLTGLTSR